MNDKQMIDEAYNRLLESYMNSNHRKKVDIIQKAYNFALRIFGIGGSS